MDNWIEDISKRLEQAARHDSYLIKYTCTSLHLESKTTYIVSRFNGSIEIVQPVDRFL